MKRVVRVVHNRRMQGMLFFGAVAGHMYKQWVWFGQERTTIDAIATTIMMGVLLFVVVPFMRDALRNERELQRTKKVLTRYASTFSKSEYYNHAVEEALPSLTARWFVSDR